MPLSYFVPQEISCTFGKIVINQTSCYSPEQIKDKLLLDLAYKDSTYNTSIYLFNKEGKMIGGSPSNPVSLLKRFSNKVEIIVTKALVHSTLFGSISLIKIKA